MRENTLTEKQQLFVLHFTSTPGAIGNASEAARRAGYSEKSAGEIGRQLLDKPHVMAAIEDANRRQISSTAATKATDLLVSFVEDETVSARVRLEAAKTILDRAGYIPPKAAAPAEDEHKPMSEMTLEELDAIIAKNKAWLDANEGKEAAGQDEDEDEPTETEGRALPAPPVTIEHAKPAVSPIDIFIAEHAPTRRAGGAL